MPGNLKMTSVPRLVVHRMISLYASVATRFHSTPPSLRPLLKGYAWRGLVMDPTLTWLLTLMDPIGSSWAAKLGRYGWQLSLIKDPGVLYNSKKLAHSLI